jgi:bifunctional UDP-N-acetylglucosamine pyrophosphorylase/glucosamine-1-phosphate N-acetyltransferase
MKSALPKVMHRIAGRSMVGHVLDNLLPLQPARLAVVVGPDMPSVAAEVAPHPTVIQQEQLGTGHAVAAACAAIGDFEGTVLVLFGDAPCVSTATMQRLAERRSGADDPAVVVLGMRPADPTGYGRLIVDDTDALTAIVEHRDADAKQRKIGLCNSGVMAIDGAVIWRLIDAIKTDNAKQEYYLTDVVHIARGLGRDCAVVEAPVEELIGVNNRIDLAEAESIVQKRLRLQAMENGATLTDPASVFFCSDTRLGRDVTIGPNVVFGPGVSIADGAEILGFCHITGARIESGAIVGPFARLRPGAHIDADAHVGNFVELKNAHLGKGAKANHLTYLGDAEIGPKSNIGAGTITCNYDGFFKDKTKIGAEVFIGSNSALVAPVEIGDRAFIAAGSVITRNVAPDAMAMARGQQVEKAGWAAKFRAARKALKEKLKS